MNITVNLYELYLFFIITIKNKFMTNDQRIISMILNWTRRTC
jgi:hypothetical protein